MSVVGVYGSKCHGGVYGCNDSWRHVDSECQLLVCMAVNAIVVCMAVNDSWRHVW